ncbi:uncharacterized protein IL334_006190 [Kwoniella shivajii]|uniref:Uncharacterized protein n=1 Tax=Kwoniella shivajii TaxID=564305 RepID=A0ABZ1D586_9TREE|nr:hypothetical protein IL334_006190 [Kwoniella shivajii]
MTFLSFGLPILSAGLGLIPILILHFRSYLSSSQRPSSTALPSLFFPAITTHGRYLPVTAKNAFTYSVLYLGVDIDSLESGSLDLPFNVVKYGGNPLTKLIGLRSRNYLSDGDQGFRVKLENLLDKYGIEKDDIGKVWLVTLPSLAGWEGPNPLSTWFIYRKTKDEKIGDLLCVVLEVHSTFGESHSYVLKNTSEYRQDPAPGYDLAFKIPRSFHVSPFNSRDGYYRVDLMNPFPDPDPSLYQLNTPKFKIFLKLFTSEDQHKLTATLSSGPSPPIPLEPYFIPQILSTLIKWPFTLMSVTFRTYVQAYKLHYVKKLALFPRPEPSSETSHQVFNPPSVDREKIGRGLQRQPPSWTENKARKLFEKWAEKRVKDSGIDLEISFGNGRQGLSIPYTANLEKESGGHSNGRKYRSELRIKSSDPTFFTNLLVSPSPRHSLILFPEQSTTVSSSDTFLQFLSCPTIITTDTTTSFTSSRRIKHFLHLYASSVYAPPPSIPPILSLPAHFTQNAYFSFRDRLDVARVVFWYTFGESIEESLFNGLGVSFVQGQEPWKIWERGLKRLWGIDTIAVDKLGSYQIQ